MEQRVYTFNQAAEIVGLDPGTLRAWRRTGKLVCIRIGGSRRGLRIPQCEINRLLSQVEIGPQGTQQKVG